MLFCTLLCVVVSSVFADDLIHYDTLTGKNLTIEELKAYVKANTTFWCAGSYKPCDPNEGRRMDATCNNLKLPYRGASHTPPYREIPAMFGEDNTPRKTKSGKKTGPSRKERTATLIEGSIPDTKFTSLTVHYMLFINNNLASIHDTISYVRWVPYCCKPEGKKDPRCNPMEIPEDDTVHQFSGIRCMNMTKPITYQSVGCTQNKSLPLERLNSAHNFMDLSMVYGFDNQYRKNEDGLLQYDVENGKIWPVSTDAQLYCLLNQLPKETRCHKNAPINGLVGTNFFSIIFWRLHNYIATKLKEINPGWDDEKLFSVAKDLNIALSTQIYYYELAPELLGKVNLQRDGIIVQDGGFRDEYDENLVPQVSIEYAYSLRWGHTIQPGMAKLYDSNSNYLKQIPSVNLTLRTGWYAVDNNMEGFTQGAIIQPMGKSDHVIEPTMSETGLSYLQRAFDIAAADLEKGGLQGIPTYVHYRRLCSGRKYGSFDDLAKYGDMDPEYVRIVKDVYEDVEDIPLIVGLWLENHIPGGYVPRTLYCLKMKQMKKFPRYDRHWYENANRPNGFTKNQLQEIRNASIAWVLCTVGDSVTRVQPNAFLLEGYYNRRTSCKNIPQIDFTAWKDNSSDCENKK